MYKNLTRHKAVKVGGLLGRLYQKCWESSVKNYSGSFKNKELADKTNIVELTNTTFHNVNVILEKKIKSLNE